MFYDYDQKLISRAKQLRKEMTPQERKLWYCFLRDYPVKFIRQRSVGHYIVDFYCASAQVAIEVDGGEHYEAEGLFRDERRTEYLNSIGVEVFRVTNTEVNVSFEAVCMGIDQFVQARTNPSGRPSDGQLPS